MTDATDGSTPPDQAGLDAGYVIILSALLMVPLLVAVGFAVDIGAWYAQANREQKAVDAAALAGVVWMPNTVAAETAADRVIAKNGFDPTEVLYDYPGGQQIQVNLTSAADLFFSQVAIGTFSIERQAVAEYVLPVPMGSPKNYLGTGPLVSGDPEGFWLSINGACSRREQGDNRSPMFALNYYSGTECPSPGPGPDNGSPYTIPNPTFVADCVLVAAGCSATYEYIVELPESSAGSGVTPLTYNIAIYDAAKFEEYPGTDPTWYPDYNNGSSSAFPITTSYAVREPDLTPLDFSDNPYEGCNGLTNPRTFSGEYNYDDTTTFTSGLNILGRERWTRLCTIPAGSPSGQYLVQVETLDGELGSNQINSQSLFVQKGNSTAVCDTRTDLQCAGVFGKDYLSVFARSTGASQAEFFFAEVGDEHQGKVMTATLFDPGEGGDFIQFLDPDGNPVSFDFVTYDPDTGLAVPGSAYSGTNVTSVIVSGEPGARNGNTSGYKFNDYSLEITIDLPNDFSTAYTTSDRWWKVFYQVTGGVTDRTVWQVEISGDPVRLVS